MVDRNDALLRELDDEIRADKYRKLWEQYRHLIIGAIIALPVAAGVWQIYDGARRSAAEAAGAKFEEARRLLSENKAPEAAKAFTDIAASGPAGYATLARFQSASALVKNEKPAEAVAAFEAIASDGSANKVLRDLAKLQAASLRLDGADWTEMQNRLNDLMDEKNAFRSLAREIFGLAAMKAGKSDEARRAFLLVLADAKASQSQKDRVQGHMAGVVSTELAKTGDKSAAKNPADAKPDTAAPTSK